MCEESDARGAGRATRPDALESLLAARATSKRLLPSRAPTLDHALGHDPEAHRRDGRDRPPLLLAAMQKLGWSECDVAFSPLMCYPSQ